MIWLYNIFIFLYPIAIRIAAIWNPKAEQWIEGRKDFWSRLEDKVPKTGSNVWFHASSAGEFEQAKPLIKAVKDNFPTHKILISFYSPSGYKAAKDYSDADHIFYLPVDTKRNAATLLELIKPQLVIFIKYDFWYYLLKAASAKNIQLLLITAVFNETQPFFKWYGSIHKKMLCFFTQIFVQDIHSLELLKKSGINTGNLSGDTRFDRVSEIAEDFVDIPYIKEFIGDKKVLIAGSTWPGDEELLEDSMKSFPNIKLIIAPHEIHAAHLKKVIKIFPQAIFYSALKNIAPDLNSTQVLIIDNVGMLSRLYYYASIAFIGGGFTKSGIHNTLEAAVFGKPIIFGPHYKKYAEAIMLVAMGGAASINTTREFVSQLNKLINEPVFYQQASEASLNYINGQRGATKKILNYIQEKRLLTS